MFASIYFFLFLISYNVVQLKKISSVFYLKKIRFLKSCLLLKLCSKSLSRKQNFFMMKLPHVLLIYQILKTPSICLTLGMLGNFPCFCCLLTFFKINFFKNYFMNTIRLSNSLDPDLGPNCFKGYQQTTKVAASKEELKAYQV